MNQVRIGVVGAGLIGKRRLQLVAESARAELVGVADPDPQAARLAEQHGVPFFDGIGGMLGAARPDAVIVATPNRLHVEHALACVAAGTPVLVEKPISDTLEGAHRLADAAEASGVPVLVGHHRRHSAILRRAHEVIAEGRIGDPVAIMGSALYYKPDDYFRVAAWRTEAAGGPILINLIHEIDVLRMICGEIVEVDAIASNVRRRFSVEDTVALSIRFASGALGSFILSDSAASVRSWENLSGEDPAFPRYPAADCYVVAGTRGSLEVPTMRLRTSGDQPSWWSAMQEEVLVVEESDPLRNQLDHFCDVAAGLAAPVVSARDAARTLEVVLDVADVARRHLVAAAS